MARSGKFVKMAEQRDMTPLELAIFLVEEHGGISRAAMVAGVYPYTIQRFLDQAGATVEIETVARVIMPDEVKA